jgi:hypothetical protein
MFRFLLMVACVGLFSSGCAQILPQGPCAGLTKEQCRWNKKQAYVQGERRKWVARKDYLDKELRLDVLRQNVKVGMNLLHIQVMFGSPTLKKSKKTKEGLKESWFYLNSFTNKVSSYHFTDWKLTHWEQDK